MTLDSVSKKEATVGGERGPVGMTGALEAMHLLSSLRPSDRCSRRWVDWTRSRGSPSFASIHDLDDLYGYTQLIAVLGVTY
jgi:hypothetical protein